MIKNVIIISCNCVLFASYEKMRKEVFVLLLTNSKTKKQLMKFYNLSSPSIIISKDGTIQFCNEKFEQYMVQNVGLKHPPSNIIKFLQNDKEAYSKVIEQIKFCYKNTMSKKTYDFELLINKKLVLQNQELASHSSHNGDAQQQLYFNQFEALYVKATMVSYKSCRCIKLCIYPMNEHKSKLRLLSMHQNMIKQVLIGQQKKMEHLHKDMKLKGENGVSSRIEGLIGSSDIAINMVNQIKQYFNHESNLTAGVEENYYLSEEVEFCIERLTAHDWDRHFEIYLSKQQFPRKVVGDLQKFRICFQSLLEFGI